MKITGIRTDLVSISGRNLCFVRTYTDEGIVGVGECAACYGAGSRGLAPLVEELYDIFLQGQDPRRIDWLYTFMRRGSFWGRTPAPLLYSAISGIEQSLWDIYGKSVGLPVYMLLGGACREKIRLYANGWSPGITERTPEAYRDAAARTVADGYTALKFDPFILLQHRDPAMPLSLLNRVVALIEGIREGAGPDVDLCLEIHGLLDAHAAIRLARAVEGLGFLFYEEPVEPSGAETLAMVAGSTSIPIATGERLCGREGFLPYLQQQAVQIIQPDTGICGGIMETKKIAAMAEAYQVAVAPHNYCGPVNQMVALHLDANLPNFVIQEWRPYEPSWHYELAMEPLPPLAKDGYMPLPTKPGLGVELNDDLIAKHPYQVHPRRGLA